MSDSDSSIATKGDFGASPETPFRGDDTTTGKVDGKYQKPLDFTEVNKNMLPTVVLVGRPNVGKSALFNRFVSFLTSMVVSLF